MQTETDVHSPDRQELIAFRIGAQEFCVNIQMVREIRGWTPATPVPHAPSFVRGCINLRGAVLPVIDLGARLGLRLSEPTVRHVIIVAHIGAQLVGLLVDAVCDILSISGEAVQPTPELAYDTAKLFVKGLLPIDGRMISLVSLEKLLPDELELA